MIRVCTGKVKYFVLYITTQCHITVSLLFYFTIILVLITSTSQDAGVIPTLMLPSFFLASTAVPGW